MAALKIFVILSVLVALASCAPGGFFGKHEHHTIHVPYNVHTVHHHHVKKIHVPYPVVKEVPVIKEVHVPVYKEVHVPVHIHHEKQHHHEESWSGHGSDW